MRLAGPAAALGLGFAGLFLSTSGTLFNWDALFLAEQLRSGDWAPLIPPYRPLSTLPAMAWWAAVQGFFPEPLAALQVLSALLSAGTLSAFFVLLARQTGTGYFLSQEGEWDTNGEALWLLWRYANLSGRQPPAAWRDVLRSG